jgi:hypothetical protein
MKYALVIYSEPGSYDALSDAEREAVSAEYNALSEDPRCVGEGRLPMDAATTVRVQDGRTLTTDGPFADTKEVLGGFYIFEAGDLDEAIALAARIPAARLAGAVEVRPVAER